MAGSRCACIDAGFGITDGLWYRISREELTQQCIMTDIAARFMQAGAACCSLCLWSYYLTLDLFLSPCSSQHTLVAAGS